VTNTDAQLSLFSRETLYPASVAREADAYHREEYDHDAWLFGAADDDSTPDF
jgi:hypothetical protein